MKQNYGVRLHEAEREKLESLIRKGKSDARTIRRAHSLLRADSGESDADSAALLHVSRRTIARTRRLYCADGLDAALADKPRSGRPSKFDARQEAYIVATACSAAPDGYDHWTVRLLAAKAVELGLVESVSPQTISTTLKKTSSSRGKSSSGAFPPPMPHS